MPANPFPDVTIPGIASGVKYCIFRVDRAFDGMFEGSERAVLHLRRRPRGQAIKPVSHLLNMEDYNSSKLRRELFDLALHATNRERHYHSSRG